MDSSVCFAASLFSHSISIYLYIVRENKECSYCNLSTLQTYLIALEISDWLYYVVQVYLVLKFS
jgi:hypothetical protein